jgi:hypothetical protein
MDETLYTAYLKGVLMLSERGIWHHEGTRFSNQKVSKLFHRSIQWNQDEQQYYVCIGKGRATFDCEDTAYFVSTLNDTTDPWTITLLDDTTEELKPDTLHLGPADQIYCEVKGSHRARFMRNAHQILLEHAVNDDTVHINGEDVRLVMQP